MTTRPPNANYLAPASVVSDQVHRGRSLFRAAAESFEELLESRRILYYHTTINPLVESVNDGSVYGRKIPMDLPVIDHQWHWWEKMREGDRILRGGLCAGEGSNILWSEGLHIQI